MTATVKQSGDPQTNRRPPTVGSIGAGIKILTAAAAKLPGLKEALAEGNASGASYEDIVVAMKQANPKCPAYPLKPSNAPYFRVHQSAFTVPGAAQAIMDAYATQRPGDTEPHLYSFPIIFRSDDIDQVFHERFEAWTASGILRWSHDGRCMKKEELAPDKNRRRRWGGRTDETVGLCDPNNCELYQAEKQQCFHSASLYFMVPVVDGVGLIKLSFKSVYATVGIQSVLPDVMAGLRRISGLYQNQPIFYLSKRPESISMMDWQAGKPMRRTHDIIHLEASGINMMRYLSTDQAPAAPGIAAPQKALPATPAPATPAPATPAPATPTPATPTPATTAPEHEVGDTVNVSTGEVIRHGEVRRLRGELAKLLPALQWSPEDLREWIVGTYSEESAAHKEDALIDMIQKLTALAASMQSQTEAAKQQAESDPPL